MPRLLPRTSLALGFILSVSLHGARIVQANVPANFSDDLVATVGSPTALAYAPDGRLFVTTQPGALRVVCTNTTAPGCGAVGLVGTAAITFGSGGAPKICNNGERGLLGVALDPDFGTNRYIYLYYTFDRAGTGACSPTGGAVWTSSFPANRVSRFTMDSGGASLIAPASELVLLDNMPSPNGNHNGGDLKFGRDGNLYVSIGDGGCDYAGGGCAGGNDATRDLNTLTGKLLRIRPDGSVPSDNPFLGAGTARCNMGGTTPGTKCQETFSWGLRNPFRFATDGNDPGTRVFIDDVGQGLWEEIDAAAAGADFGWNVCEGNHANNSTGPCTTAPAGAVFPLFDYQHGVQIPGTSSSASCNSITGGAFVPNGLWPVADGTYLFADFICGTMPKIVNPNAVGQTVSDFGTSFGANSVVMMLFAPCPAGSCGNAPQALYYTTFAAGGQVRRIYYSEGSNLAPTAVAAGAPSAPATPPFTVTLDATGSSDPDVGNTLTYFWDFGDGTPVGSTASLTLNHTYALAGTYDAVLRARDDHFAFSPPQVVTVTPGYPPTARDFFSIPPCRAVDTRAAQSPALGGGTTRVFTLAGNCGLPVGAIAVALNVTVVSPGGAGELRLFRSDGKLPLSTTIAFATGRTRANNAVVTLSADGKVAVHGAFPATSNADVVVDVVGYFE